MSNSGRDSGETTTFQSGPHGMPELDEEAASLPVIDLHGDSAIAEFELGETLGEGGMGQVVSAKQKALQRSVAIKFLRVAASDASVLLREAITTGRLEHPNIVPVHVLAKTSEGVTFFAMKRVEGTPWSEALRGSRPLVEHLEILQRVCDAVAFAHSRGVIHRDLKPANVLLGAFGEVYLVDWGLAASLRQDSVLPLASEASLAGTPAYIAPEAASGAGHLGPWTDVFLLGASLYEVLTGQPPWSGGSVAETLVLAASSTRELAFDAKVPAELANICRRAMQRSPEDRFESAVAFRNAITAYLRHREAFELHERTLTNLGELERVTRGEVTSVPVERLFTECRFGFQQVRASWPEFEPARAGLRRALTLMIRHELARKAPQSARSLLTEMEHPPTELVMEVEQAERIEQERAARLFVLEQQAKDLSPDSARDLKSVYVKAVAVGAVSFSVLTQALETSGTVHFNSRDGLVFSVVTLLNGLGYSAWLRRQVEANQLQRRIAVALIGLSVLSGLGWGEAYRGDLSLPSALIMYFLISAAGWWTAAVAIETRGAIVAMGFLVAALLAMVFPSFALLSGGCVGLSFWVLSRLLRTSRVAAQQ